MKTKKTEVIAGFLRQIFAGDQFPPCRRRNGKPSDGWSVVGHPGITRAIKMAGLPWEKFWSGKNPTPSTQAPTLVVMTARELWDGETTTDPQGYNTDQGFRGSVYARCPHCGELVDCGTGIHYLEPDYEYCCYCERYFWYNLKKQLT
ncbi:MAG: hypothetical protein JRJ62_15805 [Deltaproteobacteria bacterium]|nr:hypothetical protein [Deltaproteobacteria bacterium]